jgi:hypothetical protein
MIHGTWVLSLEPIGLSERFKRVDNWIAPEPGAVKRASPALRGSAIVRAVNSRADFSPLRRAELRSQLLAAFVVFHVLSMLVLALPASGRLSDRAVWQSRENQLQFARWAKLSSRLGVARTGPELEEQLWQFMQRYLRVRGMFAAPFELYASYTGTAQGWRMFSTPQSHPAYVHVELAKGAGFEPIYVSRSDEFTWHREQFDHHRLRKLFGRVARSTEETSWEQFGQWAARQAARDVPDADGLRIWQERRTTPEPGSPAGTEPAVPEQIRIYDLRQFR